MHPDQSPNLDQITIGIVGGGQLGRMLAEAASRLGQKIAIIDPDPDAPAFQFAHHALVGEFSDPILRKKFADLVDVITYEFDNVSVEGLQEFEAQGILSHPSSFVAKTLIDKYVQRSFLATKDIPQPEFREVSELSELQGLDSHVYGNKVVLKRKTGGYDGKGVVIIDRGKASATDDLPDDGNWMVEQMVPLARELSVLVARNSYGDIKSYPVVENVVDPDLLLLAYSIVPARIDDAVEQKARKVAQDVVEALDGVGIYAIELFETHDGGILVNEIAARPHNTGHFTADACMSSQFDQLARALVGAPLGATDLYRPIVMGNIIGDDNIDEGYALGNGAKALDIPGVKLHLYTKAIARKGRKMGHFSVQNENIEEAIKVAQNIQTSLHFLRKNPHD